MKQDTEKIIAEAMAEFSVNASALSEDKAMTYAIVFVAGFVRSDDILRLREIADRLRGKNQ